MTKSNISYNKIVYILTNGAPAMVGKEKGFVKRIKDKNAEILSYIDMKVFQHSYP
jgi:hypothetical protein